MEDENEVRRLIAIETTCHPSKVASTLESQWPVAPLASGPYFTFGERAVHTQADQKASGQRSVWVKAMISRCHSTGNSHTSPPYLSMAPSPLHHSETPSHNNPPARGPRSLWISGGAFPTVPRKLVPRPLRRGMLTSMTHYPRIALTLHTRESSGGLYSQQSDTPPPTPPPSQT